MADLRTITSRRAVLAGIATTPALAVAPALAGQAADAELSQLGMALDSLGEEWLAQVILDRKYAGGILIDPDPDGEGWGDFHDRLYPLVEKIMSLKATTLAGLSVQTSAIMLMDDEDPNIEGCGGDPARLRLFLESLCSFLSIAPAPMRLRLGQAATAFAGEVVS